MFEFCFRANVATMIVCGQWFKFSVRLCFIYFLTSPLCLHYQVQPCGVEKRAGCSGPSTKIIWSKVGFVCCSRAPLWPWPVLGTPSSFPWFSLQLLLSISHRSVVILELFSLNRVILWQLLTGACRLRRVDGKCGQMLACLLARDAFAVTQKHLCGCV